MSAAQAKTLEQAAALADTGEMERKAAPDVLGVVQQLDFPGTARFTLRRRLGAGSFGTVYEAYDRQRDAVVALKVLNDSDAAALYRFKQEFRSLADLVHRNLVTLYELLHDGDRWFFTMERIEGQAFLDHVRSAGAVRLDRLADALLQLAEGLLVLHDAGKLHRDIKPSNVLVQRDGRVVILDFGLASEMMPLGETRSSHRVVGTPSHMSPEQAGAYELGPATDWYSVGVMIYEAITGWPPFQGTVVQVLLQKRLGEAPQLSQEAPWVPEELDRLCADLLRQSPEERPTGAEVVSRLRKLRAQLCGTSSQRRYQRSVRLKEQEQPVIGRERHLKALEEAFGTSSSGRTVVARCHGGPGMGKTTLVRHFLRGLAAEDRDAVILTGRCYEHEEVPFKGMDGVVDTLSRYLKRLPVSRQEALLPRDSHALSRLFPVLMQVPAMRDAPIRNIADAQKMRQAAFTALRELLLRLSDRRPLIMFIDDLQWGDLDSVSLLLEVLRPPDPPPLLLIAAYRTEEAATSPVLAALLDALGGDLQDSVVLRELSVGELLPSDAAALAQALLRGAPGNAAPDAQQARVIAMEGKGSPFFITELCQHARERRGGLEAQGDTTVDSVIRTRLEAAPLLAQRMVELVAVSGQPVLRAIAAAALDAGSAEQQALALLRSAHLVRIRKSSAGEGLDTYHDEVRRVVMAGLSAAKKREIHLKLARALEESGQAEPEHLVFHYQQGRDLAGAARHAVQAVKQAQQALAFDRVARLCRAALGMGTLGEPRRRELKLLLAGALAAMGRPKEAADAYVALAEQETPSLALQHRRCAMEQLFRGGYFDEGQKALEPILLEVRLRLPRTQLVTLFSMWLLRLWLWLRGLGFRERSEAEVPARELLRVDTCKAAALGFAILNPIRCAHAYARYLLLALRAGEPRRIAHALCGEACFAAYRGKRDLEHADRLLQKAAALAEKADCPYTRGMTMVISGFAAVMSGEWKRGYALGQKAETMLQEHCSGVAHELAFNHLVLMLSLVWQGEIRELVPMARALIKDARERRDRYGEFNLRVNSYITDLAADQPGRARQAVGEALLRWSPPGFQIQHYAELLALVRIALYEGEGTHAFELITRRWRALTWSGVLWAQFLRIETRHVHAMAALAAAQQGGARDAHLRIAEKQAGKLMREKAAWAEPLSRTLMAALARWQGRGSEALSLLGLAEEGFARCDMVLYAQASRRRRGEWLGGEEGRALVRAADEWMVGQKIQNPARMSGMLVP